MLKSEIVELAVEALGTFDPAEFADDEIALERAAKVAAVVVDAVDEAGALLYTDEADVEDAAPAEAAA